MIAYSVPIFCTAGNLSQKHVRWLEWEQIYGVSYAVCIQAETKTRGCPQARECALVSSCLVLIKPQPLCRMFDVTDVLVTSSPLMTELGENDCGFSAEKHLSSAALSSRACKSSRHERLGKMKRRNVHPCEAPANARTSLRSAAVCFRMPAVLSSLMGQREVEENRPQKSE